MQSRADVVSRRVRPIRRPADTRGCMFYFFRRNGSSIRCEVRADSAGDGYELIVDRPNATLSVEHFGAPPELNRRWREIERSLVREGWQGPHPTR